MSYLEATFLAYLNVVCVLLIVFMGSLSLIDGAYLIACDKIFARVDHCIDIFVTQYKPLRQTYL